MTFLIFGIFFVVGFIFILGFKSQYGQVEFVGYDFSGESYWMTVGRVLVSLFVGAMIGAVIAAFWRVALIVAAAALVVLGIAYIIRRATSWYRDRKDRLKG